jgi:hypothetical protein
MVENDTLLSDYPTESTTFKNPITITVNEGVDTWNCYNSSSLKCQTITFAVVCSYEIIII